MSTAKSTYIAILAGGGGTRLWPLSRRSRPKQFLPLLPGGESLLAATVRRVLPVIDGGAPIERVLVVTAADQIDEVRRALPQLPPENVIAEPVARNTAAAIGLCAVAVRARAPEAVVAVLPSDHFVADEPRFVAAMQQAIAAAQQGKVATVGIRPTRPETGFGYIQRKGSPAGAGDTDEVLRFVEKPDRATAERYVLSGDYLWNAGMFFFSAARMLDEIRRHLPPLGAVLDEIARFPSRTPELYPTAPAISIDYAVMEKLPESGGLVVVPGEFGWSDVGSWDALAEVRPADEAGNVSLGETVAVDAHDNILCAEDGRAVAAVGVSGLVIVAAGDAVLVVPRERAQDVRKVVAALESRGRTTYL